MDIAVESVGEPTGPKRGREIIDQFRCRDKQRIEAVLDGAVGKGHRQMRFATTRFPAKDHTATLRDEIRGERRTQERQTDRGLHGEIEIIDRLEKWEVRAAHHARHARLLALRDFFRDEECEEIAIAPLLALRALYELAPRSAGIRQVQALEEGVELGVGEIDGHRRPPSASKG